MFDLISRSDELLQALHVKISPSTLHLAHAKRLRFEISDPFGDESQLVFLYDAYARIKPLFEEQSFHLLRLDLHQPTHLTPYEDQQALWHQIQLFCQQTTFPMPHDVRITKTNGETTMQCYWALDQLSLSLEPLLQEIVLAHTLTGYDLFAYSIYFMNQTLPLLFHLCDDTRLDVISTSHTILLKTYELYLHWLHHDSLKELDQLNLRSKAS